MSHDVGLLLISMANDMTFKNWSKHFWGGLSSTILKPAGCVSAEKKTINSSPSNLSSRTCWYLSGFKFSKGERGYGGLVWVISRVKNPLLTWTHTFFANQVVLSLIEFNILSLTFSNRGHLTFSNWELLLGYKRLFPKWQFCTANVNTLTMLMISHKYASTLT